MRLRWFLPFLVLLLCCLTDDLTFGQEPVRLPGYADESRPVGQQMEFVPGSYLVEFQDDLPGFAQANAPGAPVQGPSAAVRVLRRQMVLDFENAARASLGVARATERDVIVHEYRLLFNGVAARLQPTTVEDLRKAPGIKAVWPQRIVQVSSERGDASEVEASGLPGVPEQLAYSGRGTVIAVLDTGIDYRHPDLGGCLGPDCKVIGGYDFANGDSDPLDGHGHGTHVAGIAAANGKIRGVAPDARLLAVKVLNDNGSGPDSNLIAGLEWAVANGADVINLSLGSPAWPENDPLSRAAEKVVDHGVVVVAAVGNSGPLYYTIGSPAIAQKAISVGASDNGDKIANFSSCGPTIDRLAIKPDLLAPGMLRSTLPIDQPWQSEPYGTRIGTSMAAPYVAGAAALLLERSPDWTPLQVKQGLVAHARDLSGNVFAQGAGHIDIEKALSSRTTISEGPLGLGLLYPGTVGLSHSAQVQFMNFSADTLVYDLQLDGEPHAGLVVELSTNRLVVPPGQSALLNVAITAHNALLPSPSSQPADYSTILVAAGETDSLRLPIALVKGASVLVTLHNAGYEPGKGPMPSWVGFHDGKGNAHWKDKASLETGVFRLVVPPGSYDMFAPFSAGQAGLETPRFVLKESIDLESVDSEVQLKLDLADAVHELSFRPSFPGDPGVVSVFGAALFTHRSSGYSIPLTFRDTLICSNVSDRYSVDMALVGAGMPTKERVYLVPHSLPGGVSTSQLFENNPDDFRHAQLDHSLRRMDGSFMTRLDLNLGARQFSVDYKTVGSSGRALTHLYLGTPRTPMLVTPQLTESFMQGSTSYQTAGWHAVSRSEVRSGPAGQADVVLGSGTLDFLPGGVGPYYWFGRFGNSPGQIAVGQSAGQLPVFVLGQAGDYHVDQSVKYELRRDGTLLKSGYLVLYPSGGAVQNSDSIQVEPGQQNLTLTVPNPADKDHPSKVTCDFDTRLADPNPPHIVGFRLLKGEELTEVLSAARSRRLVLRVGDDSGLARVALIYGVGGAREEIPLTRLGQNEYQADLPPLPEASFATLLVELADTSNNTLQFETTIPRGFPDLTVSAASQDLPVGRTWARQITVSNRGYDSTDSPIAVTEQLPDGLRFIRATGEGWQCTAVDRILTCECAARLHARTKTSFTVFTEVSRAAYPSVTGTISVRAAEDEDQTNDTFQYTVAAEATPWWRGLGPAGGEIYALATDDENKLYAGTRGQIFTSEDSGLSWTPLTRSLPDAPVTAIALDPTRQDVMFAGTDGAGIYRSTDRGKTWFAVPARPGTGRTVLVVRTDPRRPDCVYAGFAGGAERSTDGGMNWEVLPIEDPASDVSDFAFPPANASVVYAGTAGGVFKSTDGGSSWSLSLAVDGAGLSGSQEEPGNLWKWVRFVLEPHDSSILYATTMAGLYSTTDNDSTWQRIGTCRGGDIVIFPNQEATVVVGGGTQLLRRLNKASFWSGLSIGCTGDCLINALALSGDGGVLYAATRSGIYQSENKGDDWAPSGSIDALGATSLVFDPSQAGAFFLASDQGIAMGSGGSDWSFPAFPDLRPQEFLVADPARPGTLYAAGSGVFKSTDGGRGWQPASLGLTGMALESVSALALDPRNGTTLYIGTADKTLGGGEGVFRSSDGAASWHAAGAGLPASAGVSCLAVDPATGHVYAGIMVPESAGTRTFALYRSTNAGVGWSLVGTGLPGRRINVVVFGESAIPGAMFLGTEGAGVYRSDDRGLTWAPASQGLAAQADIRALTVGPAGELFAAAYGAGVFRSADGGGRWEAFDQGLASLWVTSLALDPNDPRNLYVATSGGVFSLTLSPDFSLAFQRTEQLLTGGAGVWNLSLVNEGSAANAEPIELAFGSPPGLRLLRSAGQGWTCTQTGATTRCLNQARVERGTSAPPLSLTFEVDEEAESSLSAEIRADVPEDLAPQNDRLVDRVEPLPGSVSRIALLATDPASFVGLALSSWSAEPTEVVLTALDGEGRLIDLPRNPAFLTLEPGAQLARQTWEWLGEGSTPDTRGWLRIAADRPVGNMYQFGAERQLDGGVGASGLWRKLTFTRACEGEGACWGFTGKTVIGLANPGSTPVTVRAVLREDSGVDQKETVRLIPAKGSLSGSLTELFGPAPIKGGRVEVEVVEDEGGVIGVEQVYLAEARSLVSLPAQPAVAAMRLYSAQLADVPGLFTRLRLVNRSQLARTVRVKALGDDGQPIAEPKEFTMKGVSAIDVDCGAWLEWLPGKVRIGTLVIQANGPGLIGDVLFGGTQGETAAALPLQTSPFETVSFGQVANGMGLYTGLALYNPGSEPVQVTILVATAQGETAGQATFTLAPGTRLARVLPEVVPSSDGQIGGSITISASGPIVAQELFGGANMLSAVPPQSVP